VFSKSQIDKAGKVLSTPKDDFDENYLKQFSELEVIFNKFRESHLSPLTALTAAIQTELAETEIEYYIAQRLKRKPQILRKLNRLSVRLTQLQDIGGLRIIVDDNAAVDQVALLVDRTLKTNDQYEILRSTDYRGKGRDDSGYRALHKIIKHDKNYLELQIRSRPQHNWAESVERTSVFYGKRIKEGEGSVVVIGYFKLLSEVYSEIERGARISAQEFSDIEKMRSKSEDVIRRDGFSHLMDGVVNEDVVKTLIQKEKSNNGMLNNWILVFDWKTANFVTWDIASKLNEEAVAQYVRYEQDYPEDQKYEVVLIGSSDISTVQKTHSHYFGLAKPDKILQDMGQSILQLDKNPDIDYGAKRILEVLTKKRVWGNKKGIQRQTLQNHFCKDVLRFEESVKLLIDKGFLTDKSGAGVTLNIAKTADIALFT
jgi:ppGpp synthetase/RelA/SpoT-type nucleotidyltranferase